MSTEDESTGVVGSEASVGFGTLGAGKGVDVDLLEDAVELHADTQRAMYFGGIVAALVVAVGGMGFLHDLEYVPVIGALATFSVTYFSGPFIGDWRVRRLCRTAMLPDEDVARVVAATRSFRMRLRGEGFDRYKEEFLNHVMSEVHASMSAPPVEPPAEPPVEAEPEPDLAELRARHEVQDAPELDPIEPYDLEQDHEREP